LPDFEKGHHLCASPGASATKTATLLGVSTATVYKIISASYTNHEKTTTATRNSGRKSTLTERDRLILRTVSKNHITTAADPKILLEDLVSTKKVRRELHRSNINPQ
jgi:transposase